MKKARMNISHFRLILFNLKIFGEIVTTLILLLCSNSVVSLSLLGKYEFFQLLQPITIWLLS